MDATAEQIKAAIAALEAQRSALGNAVLDAALAPLHQALDARGAPAEPVQRLKLVSVLFVDVVGSTAMGQTLEPEDIQAVLDQALRAFSDIVRSQAGRVLQYAGDALLAAFGAELTHEDDAECAVRAGLAILAEAKVHANHIREQYGISEFDVRTGIHTGQVLLGGGVDADATIRGAAVNIAARLEQSAPPGALRISHDTYRQVRGAFDVVEQAPIRVKGVDAMLRSYFVQGARSPEAQGRRRGVDALQVRMVGRNAELQRLQVAFEELPRRISPATVTVFGDAGLGKSRLLGEFRDWIEHQPQPVRCVEARAAEARRGQAYGLLRELFLSVLRSFDDGMNPRTWLTSLAPVLGNEDDAAVLGHLLGFDFAAHPAVAGIVDDARQIRDRAFHYAARYFHQLAQAATGRPVLLLLDDLHWADDASLDFIAELPASAGDAALLIVGMARPALLERRPKWGSGVETHQRIELEPLSTTTSLELVNLLLQRLCDVPDTLRELIVGRAEGNPFYMEERINMLIDDGVIITSEERWRVAEHRLASARLPATLVGVLQARLDALPAAEKSALQHASVLGHRFRVDTLAQLSPDAAGALPALARRDLIRLQDSTAQGDRLEYAFKHHVLHEVTYDTVLKRDKRRLHRQVALWLSEQTGAGAATELPLIAEHFERAGETQAAAQHWQRAAEDAIARDAREAALAHVQRALALLPETSLEPRFTLAVVRDRVFARQFDRAARLANIGELDRLAEGLGDDAKRFDALLCHAAYQESGGEFEPALSLATQALAKAVTPRQQARALLRTVSPLVRLGRYAQASELADTALQAARTIGDTDLETQLLNNIGLLKTEQGDPVAAQALYEQALSIQRRLGNRSGEARGVGNLAEIARVTGRYDAARAGFTEQAEVCKAIGDRWLVAMAEMNLALILLNQGEASDSAVHAQVALNAFGAMGERWGTACASVNAGHAELALGRTDAAAGLYQAARQGFDALGVQHLALEAIAGLVQVALARGELGEALAETEFILERLCAGATLEGLDEPLRVRLTCYQALAAAADPRAAGLLAQAHAELQAQARQISDPQWRESLLSNVPYHREIIATWQRLGHGGPHRAASSTMR